jgi:putative transposase
MARRKHLSISDEILDQLLAGGDPRDTLAGKDGLLNALKKAFAERALNAEMDLHLGSDSKRPNKTDALSASPMTPSESLCQGPIIAK